jgi:predicted RecB family nuclease
VAGELGEYVAIDSYAPVTDEVEAEVFLRFLDHLAERREHAARLGGGLRVYHWTAAELTAMRRIVGKAALPGLPGKEELDAMIAAEWIDLAAVFRGAVITGAGNGLKVVATAIGFSWDVDDPGGDFSMLQHAGAVGGDDDAVAWLRSYNRSDVLATYEVRRWLRESYDALPRIEEWAGLG